MAEHYWTRGGARVSGWYFTWPFAVIELSTDAIGFRLLWRRWRIPRHSLRSVHRVRGLVGKGFALEHTEDDIPADLVFFSLQPAAFERAIEHLELPLEGTHSWSGPAHL
jgi:hypothetical protein